MSSEPVDDVLNELAMFVNDSVASHGFECMGLRLLEARFQSFPVVAANPDPSIYIGIGDPNASDAKQYAVWKQSEALARIAHNGPVDTMLGQQWVVYLFTAWEHNFRPRLAGAQGCESSDLKYPLLGDLRRLRNDIVHHHGVATEANTGKCEILTSWFRPGDVISLRGEHFAEFVYSFPLRDMRFPPAA